MTRITRIVAGFVGIAIALSVVLGVSADEPGEILMMDGEDVLPAVVKVDGGKGWNSDRITTYSLAAGLYMVSYDIPESCQMAVRENPRSAVPLADWVYDPVSFLSLRVHSRAWGYVAHSVHNYRTYTSDGSKGVPPTFSVIWVGQASDGGRAELSLEPSFSLSGALDAGWTHKSLADVFGSAWGDLPTTGDCDITVNVSPHTW